MNKHTRPLGITALAFASIIVGHLLPGRGDGPAPRAGRSAGVAGTDTAAALLILGAVYLGLMVAAYFVGYGFWSQRHWSWAGGIVVFATLIVLSVFMLLLSANVLSVLVPGAGAAVAIWYLLRPETRAQLLDVDARDAAKVGEVDAARSARRAFPWRCPKPSGSVTSADRRPDAPGP